jgi:hypothetical protein
LSAREWNSRHGPFATFQPSEGCEIFPDRATCTFFRGYNHPENIDGLIWRCTETARAWVRVLPLVTKSMPMKTDDILFKSVAAIVLAGVIIAIGSPAQPAANVAPTSGQSTVVAATVPMSTLDAALTQIVQSEEAEVTE